MVYKIILPEGPQKELRQTPPPPRPPDQLQSRNRSLHRNHLKGDKIQPQVPRPDPTKTSFRSLRPGGGTSRSAWGDRGGVPSYTRLLHGTDQSVPGSPAPTAIVESHSRRREQNGHTRVSKLPSKDVPPKSPSARPRGRGTQTEEINTGIKEESSAGKKQSYPSH